MGYSFLGYQWRTRLLVFSFIWGFVILSPMTAHSQGTHPGKRAAIRAKAVEVARPIGDSEEYHLGRAVAAQILSEHPLYSDLRLTLYINEIGQVLARKSSRPNPFRGYHFAILDNPEPNAFACPGGIILVTRGLMRLCDSEDELAAALAHELAHVAHRDGIKSIKAARLAEVRTMIGAERVKRRGGPKAELVAQYGEAIADVRKTIMVNGYGRRAEWAADQEAGATLSRAGYNPGALMSLLQKIATQEEKGGCRILRTHPPAGLRLARLQAQVLKATPADNGEAARTRRFQGMMAGSAENPTR